MPVTHVEATRATPAAHRALALFVDKVRALDDPRIGPITLYGSQARGDARPSSDVDLLVQWDGPPSEGYRVTSELAADVLLATGVVLSPYPITPDHWRRIQQHRTTFYQEVARDGIRIAS